MPALSVALIDYAETILIRQQQMIHRNGMLKMVIPHFIPTEYNHFGRRLHVHPLDPARNASIVWLIE